MTVPEDGAVSHPESEPAPASGSAEAENASASRVAPGDESPDSLGSTAAAGALWTTSARVLSQVASTLAFIILARLLDPEAFGLIAMAGLFIGVANAFVDFGLGNWLIQRQPLRDRDADTVFWSGLTVSLLIAVSFLVLAPVFADLARQPELTPVLRALAVVFPLTGLSVAQAALLARRLQYRQLAIRSMAGTLTGVVAAVAAAVAGWGVWSLVVQSVVAACVATAALWLMSAWRPSLRLDPDSLRNALRFGIGIVGVSLLAAVWAELDTFLTGMALGATDAGQYAVGKKAVMVAVGMVSGVLVTVALPVFARLKADPARLGGAYVRSSMATLAMSSFLLVPIAATGTLLIPTVFGSSWQVAGQVCSLLAVQMLVASVVWPDRAALYALGRSGLEFGVTLIAIPTLVVAVLAGAEAGGVVGVAVAVLVRQLAFWPVRLVAVRHATGVRIATLVTPTLRIWVAVASGIGVGLVAMNGLKLAPVPLLAVAASAAIGAYAVALRITHPEILRDLAAQAPPRLGRAGAGVFRL